LPDAAAAFGSNRLLPPIAVQVLRAPSASQEGFITVAIPKAWVLDNDGFRFELPLDVVLNPTAGSSQSVLVNGLADGGALPYWLTFDSRLNAFSASAIPVGTLPQQIELMVNGLKTLLVIGAGN
jgi:hypothetical protein